MLVKLSARVLKFAGKVLVPPIFKVALFDTVKVPPATVVPLLAVNVERSSVPALTVMLPVVRVVEFNAFKLPPAVFVPAPLIRNVE